MMLNRVVRVVVLSVMTVGAASAALAAEPAWSYLEAGYLNVDPDALESAGDNWFAGGSLGFLKNFHVAGRYVDGNFGEDASGTEASLTWWNFAAGWHGLLGDKADLFAEATWTDIEVDGQGDDGVGLNAGIRWVPVDFLEVDGIVHWTDYSDLGSEDSYEARAIFNIWKMGLGVSAEFFSEATQYTAFARFNFGGK